MPKCASSFPLWRVSSQRTTSASLSASIARGARSARLPMGVPTRISLPAGGITPRKQNRRRRGHIERFDTVGHFDTDRLRHAADLLGESEAFASEDEDGGAGGGLRRLRARIRREDRQTGI